MATSKALMTSSRTHSTSLIPSPEASPYSEDDRGVVGTQKGWSSERVPLSGSRARRHVAASALMPFSSGRALPSKWDDAERWISSPVSVGNAPVYYTTGVANAKASHLAHRRRTKSKSGPLGQAGLRSYNSFNTYSPVLGMGVINGGQWRNSVAIESPAMVRARLHDELAVHGGGDVAGGGRRSCPAHDIDSPDWLDLWSGPPSPTLRGDGDQNIENMNDSNNQDNYEGEAQVDGAISRRDMATQMFEDSDQSSSPASTPRSSISTSSPRPTMPNNEAPGSRIIIDKSSEPESQVRDVQVDKQTSTAKSRRSSPDRDQMNDNPSNSSIIDPHNKILSKLQREEDKINAWENLQKAKAEAAIRKLEMKLEKKRSSSMEKIIDKLRRAKNKAQKMRSSLSKGDDQIQSQAVSKTTSKIPSFCRKIGLSSSTKTCSTCYPF